MGRKHLKVAGWTYVLAAVFAYSSMLHVKDFGVKEFLPKLNETIVSTTLPLSIAIILDILSLQPEKKDTPAWPIVFSFIYVIMAACYIAKSSQWEDKLVSYSCKILVLTLVFVVTELFFLWWYERKAKSATNKRGWLS